MSELDFIKRMVFREYPGKILLLIMTEVFSSFLVLIGLGGIVSVLGALLGDNSQLPGILGDLFNSLGLSQAGSMSILTFLAVVFLIRILLESSNSYISASIGIRLNRTIKTKMNKALLSADWIQFSALDQGKYMQTLVNESSLARGAVNDLGAMLAGGLMTTVLLAWMLFYSFDTFIIFSVIAVIFLLTAQTIMKRTRRAGKQRVNILKEMNNVVTDTRYLFKMLIVENLLPKRVHMTDTLINEVASVERRQAIYSIINTQYINLITIIMIVLVSYNRLVLKTSPGADLIFDLLLLQRIGASFSIFQMRRQYMLQKIPSYQACLDMMELFNPSNGGHTTGHQLSSLGTGISVENVSYSYPNGKRGVHNLTVNVPSKGLVFLVGRSGSGKTTLVDILLGLIQPDNGRILVDGNELSALGSKNLSHMSTYVPQQAYLFNGTLRDNLIFGSDGVSDETISRALDAADCGEVVRNLPQGLDTRVTMGGVNISGGERQRFAIARALIKRSQILVFDEPTSSLDANSEQLVLRSLEKLSQEMLVVVITHSQNIIQGMDNLYLMDQGSCIWHGSYSQLKENKRLISIIYENDSPDISPTPEGADASLEAGLDD